MNTFQKSIVALVRCESYDPLEVKNAVEKGIALIGGIRGVLGDARNVLIKPNALAGGKPEKNATTNPVVFGAVGACIKEAGYRCSYGDSPGPLLSVPYAMKTAGLFPVAEKLGIPLADFGSGDWISWPKGLMCKNYLIAKGVRAADAVVSMPKFKSHGLTRFTGAVKNQYGCVPGMTKGEFHARYPDPYDFSRLIADITACVSPQLYVMDAVIAMEGNGPMSGTPRPMNVLMFSTDPVALDVVCCKMIHLDTSCVPAIGFGAQAGLGTDIFESIELRGDPIESFDCPTFDIIRRPPESMTTSENPLLKIIRHFTATRPAIAKTACTLCGTCVRVCPVKPAAVDWKNNTKTKPPVYDYQGCIRCYCCQEMCPSHAISVKTPFLAKAVPILSYVSLIVAGLRRKSKRNKHVD